MLASINPYGKTWTDWCLWWSIMINTIFQSLLEASSNKKKSYYRKKIYSKNITPLHFWTHAGSITQVCILRPRQCTTNIKLKINYLNS